MVTRKLSANERMTLVGALIVAANEERDQQMNLDILINLELNDNDAKQRLIDGALEGLRRRKALGTFAFLIQEGYIIIQSESIIPDLI